MSREHKYRAWDEDTGVMYYSDKEYDDCHFGFHEGMVVAWLRETEPQTLDEPSYDYGKPIKVEQYIGFKDKNRTKEFPDGQPVYEGDICGGGGEQTYLVKFRTDCKYQPPRYVFSGIDKTRRSEPIYLDYLEIIGNVHANPELLEGK